MAPVGTAKIQAPPLTGLTWVPVAWLVFSIAMEGYRAWTTWPVLHEYGLPPSVIWLIEAELCIAAIIVIGGLFVLAAALGRAPVYPKAFTLWQGFAIIALFAIAIYTAIMPDFVMAPLSYVYWLGEILIGIACIIIVRRKPAPEEHAMTQPGTANPIAYSVLSRFILAFLGVLIGGFLGFWLGLGIGIAIAEATNMTSFEGASGYFAFFIGLLGMLLGAVIGLVLALYWTRRKKTVVVTP
jgi:hypothetical protein